MAGPPTKIHMEPDAEPRVCNIPAPVSLHWQERVKQDIRRDVALGILRGSIWSSCCVVLPLGGLVTHKRDGTPGRTVDLSSLTKFCKRETHASESPLHLTRRIPSNAWKTVTDAWNGYHSVLLRKYEIVQLSPGGQIIKCLKFTFYIPRGRTLVSFV